MSGGLGVVITALEGMLHLNQYEQNWITYPSTCESLKHKKADRVESLVSQEHAKWASIEQQPPKPSAG
jgi:hypothetical protein